MCIQLKMRKTINFKTNFTVEIGNIIDFSITQCAYSFSFENKNLIICDIFFFSRGSIALQFQHKH